MTYNDFSEMPIWQKAFELVLETYKITKTYPADERFGLISDMRRAANSITHNIAEGFGRSEIKDKTRFYKISRGSMFELQSQVMVSEALGFIDKKVKDKLIETGKEIIKDLNSLIKALES